jgi:hypothetical protein
VPVAVRSRGRTKLVHSSTIRADLVRLAELGTLVVHSSAGLRKNGRIVVLSTPKGPLQPVAPANSRKPTHPSAVPTPPANAGSAEMKARAEAEEEERPPRPARPIDGAALARRPALVAVRCLARACSPRARIARGPDHAARSIGGPASRAELVCSYGMPKGQRISSTTSPTGVRT